MRDSKAIERHRARGLVAGAGAVVLLVSVVGAAPASAAPTRIEVVQHNTDQVETR